MPFARQHVGDSYPYLDDNAISQHSQGVLDFLQHGNITKMEQPARSPDCNFVEHIWDELCHAITSMNNPLQNLGELRQAVWDKLAEIPVEDIQCLVASMPRRLTAIIAARGENT